MKQLIKSITYKPIIALLLVSFFTLMGMAQDSTVSTTSTTTTSQEHVWYTQPWVWIVGGAVLILLIVALVRGGGSSSGGTSTDKVTYTKTTDTDRT